MWQAGLLRRLHQLEVSVPATLAGGLLVLFAITFFATRHIHTLSAELEATQNSRRWLVALQNVNRGLLQAETGQRGYLLTGKAEYLNSYTRGTSATRQNLQQLAQAGEETAEHSRQVEQMTELAEARLGELRQTVELEAGSHHAQALAIVQAGSGKRMMDQLYEQTSTLIQDEQARLLLRNQRNLADTRFAQRALGFGAGMMALLALLATCLIERALRVRREHTRALEASERAVLASERRLRDIADHVPALIGYVDHKEVYRFVNARYEELFGVPAEKLLGRTMCDVLGRKGYALNVPQIQAALGGERQSFEREGGPLGFDAHFHTTYLPDINEHGNVRGFYIHVQDISERKRNELRIQEQEHFLRTITDNLPVLILYMDSARVVRFANRAYKDWLGLDPDGTIGKHARALLGDEGYEMRRASLSKALEGHRAELELTIGERKLHFTYLPDQRQDGIVRGVFALATDVTAARQAEARLDRLTRTDPLTGLPNRRHLEETVLEFLERQRTEPRPYAVLFLDIDGFKQINDGHGHAAGDEVLRTFARRLQGTLRDYDLAARLAGDEFVVLLPGLREAQDAARVAANLIAAMQPATRFGEQDLYVTPSVGIAFASGGGITLDRLFSTADRALYNAKRMGKNQWKMLDCTTPAAPVLVVPAPGGEPQPRRVSAA